MGIITKTVEVIDLHNYTPEYYSCVNCQEQIEKHIRQDGARYHVNSWNTQGEYCSEKDCEINHKCKGKSLEENLA